MDGRVVSGILKKAGLKPITSTSSIIHGYRHYGKGDFYCKTEKAYGMFGKREKFLKIHFNSEKPELKEQILKLLEPLEVQILRTSNDEIWL